MLAGDLGDVLKQLVGIKWRRIATGVSKVAEGVVRKIDTRKHILRAAALQRCGQAERCEVESVRRADVAFNKAIPVEARIDEQRGRDGVDVVEQHAPIDAAQEVARDDVVVAIATVLNAIVLPHVEEELVAVRNVVVDAADVAGEVVAANGVIKAVVLSDCRTGGVRRRQVVEDRGRNRADAIARDDVVREGLASDDAVVQHAGRRVVNCDALRRECAEITPALGFRRNRRERRLGLTLLDAFVGEEEKQLVLAVD